MLSEQDQADLKKLASPNTLPAGETVIRQRGRSYSVLIILRGHVVVISEAKPSAGASPGTAPRPEATDVLLAWRGPGDIIGEMGAITKTPRSSTVKAVEEIDILEIDGDDFVDNYLRNHFDAHVAVDKVLAQRLAESPADIRSERRKVSARAAQVLTEAADRIGRQSRGDLWVPYPRTQQDLATLIGASRESVSAALKQFRERGLVTTRPTRLIINDLEALRKEGEQQL